MNLTFHHPEIKPQNVLIQAYYITIEKQVSNLSPLTQTRAVEKEIRCINKNWFQRHNLQMLRRGTSMNTIMNNLWHSCSLIIKKQPYLPLSQILELPQSTGNKIPNIQEEDQWILSLKNLHLQYVNTMTCRLPTKIANAHTY